MKRELSDEEKRRLDSLRAVLGSNLDSRAKFELLLFWAWHPSGWSSQGALAPRSPLARSELNEALVRLTKAGVVEIRQGTGICLYRLASSHHAYAAVLELRWLTPRRRKYLLRHLRAEPGWVTALPGDAVPA